MSSGNHTTRRLDRPLTTALSAEDLRSKATHAGLGRRVGGVADFGSLP